MKQTASSKLVQGGRQMAGGMKGHPELLQELQGEPEPSNSNNPTQL
jgi:hypothetical protein